MILNSNVELQLSVDGMNDVVVFVDDVVAVDAVVSVALVVFVDVFAVVEGVVDVVVFVVAFGDGPKMNNISFDLEK